MENSHLDLLKDVSRSSSSEQSERFLNVHQTAALHQHYFYDLYRPYSQWQVVVVVMVVVVVVMVVVVVVMIVVDI